MKKIIVISSFFILFFISCDKNNKVENDNELSIKPLESYAKEFVLKADLSSFSDNQKMIIQHLIKASEYIDTIFYYENLADFKEVFYAINDSNKIKLFKYNMGPWDRFNQNKPIVEGVGKKFDGANFYPKDITKEEFEKFNDQNKNSNFTFIRRKETGELYCVPYNIELKKYIDSISVLLIKASDLSDDKMFSEYLKSRVVALQTDDYFYSDSIWLKMQDNLIDFIIGPIYINDDKLFNIKAEHQSYLLIKDEEWTNKMHKYNKWLPFLQKAIPVDEKYRAEEPGTSSSISVYDAIYFGGSSKTGGTFLSVVLPMDATFQIKYGVKNIQFKNIIQAKYEAITEPISKLILIDEQKKHVSSEVFFINSIFYEMANSLGIRNTINNKGEVRVALKDYFAITDYMKNYALSLFLAEELYEVGEIENDLQENYFTFVVNLIRLIRFGNKNDYATTNLVIFNYLVSNKAIKFKSDKIEINYEKMKTSIEELTKKIIIIQGDGNYDEAKKFIDKNSTVSNELQNIINIINNANIPTDIALIQSYN